MKALLLKLIFRYLNKLTDQTIAGLHHQGLTNEKELKRSSINLFLQAFIAITSYILAGALWVSNEKRNRVA